MSRITAIFQIILGLFLSFIGIPSQSTILVYLCTQEAMIGWLSMDICLVSRYILSALGIIALVFGVINFLRTPKKKQRF
jgi:hypothetical protein